MEDTIQNLRSYLNLKSNLAERRHHSENAKVCLYGLYRDFDFCRHSLECCVLSQLDNYSVYCLLYDSSYSKSQILEQKEKLRDYFGSKLALCISASELSESEKNTESSLLNKYCRMNPPLEEIIVDVCRKNSIEVLSGEMPEVLITAKFDNFYPNILNLRTDFLDQGNDFSLKRKHHVGQNSSISHHLERHPNKHLVCLKSKRIYDRNSFNIDNCHFISFQRSEIPVDFDWRAYCILNGVYEDELNAIHHYSNFGRLENSPYKFEELPEDFDYKAYRAYNAEVRKFSNDECRLHYLTRGKNECKKYKFDELPSDFDHRVYKLLNGDLNRLQMNEEQLRTHYIVSGSKEGRRYKDPDVCLDELPEDFDSECYKSLNSDLSHLDDFVCKFHYLKNGRKENRRYKTI